MRVRVLDDDHDRAKKLAAETKTPQGSIFLVNTRGRLQPLRSPNKVIEQRMNQHRKSSVNRISGRGRPQVRLRSHQQQRSQPLERPQVLQTVK